MISLRLSRDMSALHIGRHLLIGYSIIFPTLWVLFIFNRPYVISWREHAEGEEH